MTVFSTGREKMSGNDCRTSLDFGCNEFEGQANMLGLGQGEIKGETLNKRSDILLYPCSGPGAALIVS